MNGSEDFFSSWALSALRVFVPLSFAALGGLFSERSGVINIALEGLMLIGSFFAAWGAGAGHSPWAGVLAGAGAGLLMAALYAFFVLRLKADQIVAGTAINLLAVGLTPFFCKIFYGATGSSPSLPVSERFVSAPLWLAWVAVVLVWLFVSRTVAGLRLQFAGEEPAALSAAGISPMRVRFFALLASGALCGIGGASLSIFLASGFSRGMTAGRGYIALAALIVGKWRPWPAAFACLLFAAAEAIQIRLQGASLSFGSWTPPVQLIQALPYIATLLALGGFLGRSRPPSALGRSVEES